MFEHGLSESHFTPFRTMLYDPFGASVCVLFGVHGQKRSPIGTENLDSDFIDFVGAARDDDEIFLLI
ncbi:hypothetical protein [Bradyrhizobium tropiciagri]|uniref:hypothetical protein n=1 Tax=Bradyrhizobium tropiciagri TaxID=312253 RepID=UPI000AB5DBD3|nr:hypothetical protein [Bradyrhizobium tropiciagri]